MTINFLADASPIISFHRNEHTFNLGTGATDDVLHIYGSTGLGLAPADIALTDRINGHGSHLRGIRYETRELFIPLLIHKQTYAECTEVRRQLYRFLAPHLGPVRIQVHDPATGTIRSIEGVLRDGLTGDFSSNFHGSWQTLGLTFVCPNPYWSGPEHVLELKVSPGVKPFISQTVPFFPVILAQSTVQGQFAVHVEGDASISPIWRVSGPGNDLVITNGKERFELNHTWGPGATLTIDTNKRRMNPDLWHKVPLASRLFDLQPGTNRLNVTMTGATPATKVELIYAEQYMEAI